MTKNKPPINHINTGLILEPHNEADHVVGGVTVGGLEILKPDAIEVFKNGHGWHDVRFLGEGEVQKNRNFDTFSCFPYDTEILMEDLSKKRISEIKSGDYVITHKGRKRRVLTAMKRENNEEVFAIKISGNYKEVVCTKEHPFLTNKGWVEAKNLKKGDLVCQLLLNNYEKDITSLEYEKDKDFLWLFGLYLAEGSLGKKRICLDDNPKLKVNGSGEGNGRITFTLSSDETNIANRIIEIGKRLFDTTFTIYKHDCRAGSINVIGSNSYLRNKFEELGKEYCDKKELSTKVLLMNPILQMEIFRGWFDGDGHLDIKNKRLVGVSTSKRLIEQMHLILLRNNIKSTILKRTIQINRKTSYSINIYSKEIDKIYNLRLEYGKNSRNFNEYIDENYLYRRIEKIELRKQINGNAIKRVYNIEVEEDNSYIIENNIVVHNCVTFASLKALCKYLKYVYNEDIDPVEAYVAVMSGTVQGQGNTVRNVLDAIKNKGWLKNEECPSRVFTTETTQSQFFSLFTTAQIDLAKKKLDKYDIWYDIIDTSDNVPHSKIIENLKKAPAIVIGYAWASYYGNAGVFYDYGYPANHCFIIDDYKENDSVVDLLANDSYPFDWNDSVVDGVSIEQLVKPLAKKYKIGGAWRIYATLKDKKKTTFLTLFNKSMTDFYYFWDFNPITKKGGHNFYYIGVPHEETEKYRQYIDWNTMTQNEKFIFLGLRKSMNQSSWAEVSRFPDVTLINKKFA